MAWQIDMHSSVYTCEQAARIVPGKTMSVCSASLFCLNFVLPYSCAAQDALCVSAFFDNPACLLMCV